MIMPDPSQPPVPDQAARLRELVALAAPAHAVGSSCSIIAVTSGKGGVGKTNVSVNLAAALAARGLRVALVDADLGMANADMLCGVSPELRLHHALPNPDATVHGRIGAHASAGADLAAISVPTPLGFRFVPGSVGVARIADLPAAEQRALVRGLATLEQRHDVILIDTGAGMSDGVRSFLEVASVVLVVVTPEPPSIADAYALIKSLGRRSPAAALPPQDIRLVVNQVSEPAEGERVHGRMARVCREFLSLSLPLEGIIPHDPALRRAVMERRDVVRAEPDCPSARSLRLLAESLARRVGGPLAPPLPATSVFGARLAVWRRAFSRSIARRA